MTGCLRVWTLIVILYQTIICVTISWLTLDCQLAPNASELYEVTLMKLLYLYDPQACSSIHFYNFSFVGRFKNPHHNMLWPIRNQVASSFRRKMQLWLALHIVWLFLAVVNVTQGQRSCGFYITLVPFTITGVALLIVDLVFMSFFLRDVNLTKTEVEILSYVNRGQKNIQWINKMIPLHNIPIDMDVHDDTSWISLMFAYASCRGVVQWIVNFWIIKDNYYEGLALYRRLRKETSIPRYSY